MEASRHFEHEYFRRTALSASFDHSLPLLDQAEQIEGIYASWLDDPTPAEGWSDLIQNAKTGGDSLLVLLKEMRGNIAIIVGDSEVGPTFDNYLRVESAIANVVATDGQDLDVLQIDDLLEIGFDVANTPILKPDTSNPQPKIPTHVLDLMTITAHRVAEEQEKPPAQVRATESGDKWRMQDAIRNYKRGLTTLQQCRESVSQALGPMTNGELDQDDIDQILHALLPNWQLSGIVSSPGKQAYALELMQTSPAYKQRVVSIHHPGHWVLSWEGDTLKMVVEQITPAALQKLLDIELGVYRIIHDKHQI